LGAAFGLVAEIGDFGRFRTAEELMAFVGNSPARGASSSPN